MRLIPWHHITKAQRILARLDPDQVFLAKYDGAIPGDQFYLYGDAVDDLIQARRQLLAAKLGGSFLELEAQGRAAEWLAADAEHMSVQDVLAERFGSPMQFAGYGRDDAEHRWRIAAQARMASELAA